MGSDQVPSIPFSSSSLDLLKSVLITLDEEFKDGENRLNHAVSRIHQPGPDLLRGYLVTAGLAVYLRELRSLRRRVSAMGMAIGVLSFADCDFRLMFLIAQAGLVHTVLNWLGQDLSSDLSKSWLPIFDNNRIWLELAKVWLILEDLAPCHFRLEKVLNSTGSGYATARFSNDFKVDPLENLINQLRSERETAALFTIPDSFLLDFWDVYRKGRRMDLLNIKSLYIALENAQPLAWSEQSRNQLLRWNSSSDEVLRAITVNLLLVSSAMDRVVCLPTSDKNYASESIEQIRFAAEAVIMPIEAGKYLRSSPDAVTLVSDFKDLKVNVFADLVVGTDGVGDFVIHEVVHMTGWYFESWHINLMKEMVSITGLPAVFSMESHHSTSNRGADHTAANFATTATIPAKPEDGTAWDRIKAMAGRALQTKKDLSRKGSSGTPVALPGDQVESSGHTTPQTKVKSEDKKIESKIVYRSTLKFVTYQNAQQDVDEEPVIKYDLEFIKPTKSRSSLSVGASLRISPIPIYNISEVLLRVKGENFGLITLLESCEENSIQVQSGTTDTRNLAGNATVTGNVNPNNLLLSTVGGSLNVGGQRTVGETGGVTQTAKRSYQFTSTGSFCASQHYEMIRVGASRKPFPAQPMWNWEVRPGGPEEPVEFNTAVLVHMIKADPVMGFVLCNQIDIPDLFDENQQEYNEVKLEYGLDPTNRQRLISKQATKYAGAIKVFQQWKIHRAEYNLIEQTTEWSSTHPDSCMPVANGDLGRLLFKGFTEAQRLAT